jgi:hypothetical protein
MVKLFEHYRPELHYMRGPGPKWLEKRGIGRTGQIVNDRDSNALRLVEAIARRLVSYRSRRWMLPLRVDE